MNNTDNPTPPVGGKERTAMQTLIDVLQSNKDAFPTTTDSMGIRAGLGNAISCARKYLELERKQIEDSNFDGQFRGMTEHEVSAKHCNDYFQSKYQQQ